MVIYVIENESKVRAAECEIYFEVLVNHGVCDVFPSSHLHHDAGKMGWWGCRICAQVKDPTDDCVFDSKEWVPWVLVFNILASDAFLMESESQGDRRGCLYLFLWGGGRKDSESAAKSYIL